MSSEQHLYIRSVAVCGAGVMGAQIAALCANAGVPVLLFDLDRPGQAPGSTARQAIAHLARIKPQPLVSPQAAALITPASYDTDLARLAHCDLVLEAIAERLDWKQQLYARLAGALAEHAVLASNTSGLALAELAQALPAPLRARFCGVHFFNPPRYMPLVELTAGPDTGAQLLDELEAFLVGVLGKSVVRARDTPNFIANRVGVFGLASVFRHATEMAIPIDVADDLTGLRLGRAKSASFRTADVVGLDTLAHVLDTMTNSAQIMARDPFAPVFAQPDFLRALINKGALGQKTGAGFYRKEGRQILCLDWASGAYRLADGRADPEVQALLALTDPGARLQALRASAHPQARFVWAVLRDLLHYSAWVLDQVATSARELDQALKWGFGHELGPFELWQAAGWEQVARWLAEDIAAGKALAPAPLPDWVWADPVARRQAVHTPQGSFGPAAGDYVARSRLAVYSSWLDAPGLLGEQRGAAPEVVLQTADLQCLVLPRPQPQNILVAQFRTPMRVINSGVVQGLRAALALAKERYGALVIAQHGEPFSAGADLKSLWTAWQQQGAAVIDQWQSDMQQLMLEIRYSQVPVVAALAGLALGGGCELAVHCARRVAHQETYMGLVEVGMGLVPGAGGLGFIARQAAQRQEAMGKDVALTLFLRSLLMAAASATVSSSAAHARALGFLQDADPIIMQRHALLYVAVREAAQLVEQGWRAPAPQLFAVGGRDAAATFRAQLANQQAGGFVSAYDAEVAWRLIQTVCAAELDPGALVDDAWMMRAERRAFQELLANEQTQARLAKFLQRAGA